MPGGSGAAAPVVAVGIVANGDLLKVSSGEAVLLVAAELLPMVSGGADFLHAASASIMPINAATKLNLFIESLRKF
jgi:hypothetical protein